MVNDIPQIHVVDPGVMDHSLFFSDMNLRIPLSLNGIFSGFTTTKPTLDLLNASEDIYILTPTNWNPHESAFAHNEEQILNCHGQLADPRDR